MLVTPETRKVPAGRSGGFTLIELLAVMLILTILLTLVVGVAKMVTRDVNREDTSNTMKIIMSAISEYYESTGSYPSGDGWVSQLTTNARSRKQIAQLGNEAWDPSKHDAFLDSWGNDIEYSRTGGLAGAPGLTSGGPDGKIETREDNVRSNE